MKRKRFQILFFLRKDRMKEGKAPIYLRISCKRNSSKMSTNHHVSPLYWDSKRGYVKDKDASHEFINDYLDSLKVSIHEAHNVLIHDDEEVTARNIIRVLQGDYKRDHTLLEVFKKHNDDLKSRIGHGFSEGSHKNYRLTYRHIESYIKKNYHTSDLSVRRVDYEFISGFDHYMRVELGNKPNGSMKNLVRLKKIIRLALHNDWITKDPFRNFPIKIVKPERVFLNQDELTRVEQAELPTIKLNNVRDMFLFMCYTGLAYVDMKALNQDMIIKGFDGNMWVVGERSKSKVRFSVPLLPRAFQLLEKHLSIDRDVLFPVLSNQKMNDYIKDVMRLCNVTKRVSCHTARHTFATTVTLLNGVPIETVSRMLGHTDLRTTQIYAKVLDSKISKDMEQIMLMFSSED